MNRLFGFSAMILMLLLSSAANAQNIRQLTGDTVAVAYFFGNDREAVDLAVPGVVIQEGTTFHLDLMGFDVTVTPTQIIAHNFSTEAKWGDSAINGFAVYDQTHLFVGLASYDASSTMAGLTPRRLNYSPYVVFINWPSLSFDPQTIVAVNVNQVPEPTTYIMLAAGLALIAWRRKMTVKPCV
jgi:hypothetical protein